MINIGGFKNSEINALLLELDLKVSDITADMVDPDKSKNYKKVLMKYFNMDEPSYDKLEAMVPKCIWALRDNIYKCVLSSNFPEDYPDEN